MIKEDALTHDIQGDALHSNDEIEYQPPVEPCNHEPSVTFLLIQRWFGPFLITADTLVILLALFFVMRISLLAALADLSDLSFGQFGQLFFVGFRFDLLVALIVLLPQVTFIAAQNDRSMRQQSSKLSLLVGLFGTIMFASVICLAEILFFVESRTRLNLGEITTPDNFDMVLVRMWRTYPVGLLTFATGSIAVGLFLFMRKRASEYLQLPFSWPRRAAAFGVVLSSIIALGMITDMQSMQITGNQVADQCSGNGVFTFCHDLWERCSHDQDRNRQTTNAPDSEGRTR